MYFLRQPFLLLAPAGVVQAKPRKPSGFPRFQKTPGYRAEMSGPGIRENLWAGRILSLHPFFWSSTVLHVMLGKMCFIKFHLNSFKYCVLIQKFAYSEDRGCTSCTVYDILLFSDDTMFFEMVFQTAVQRTVRTGCTAPPCKNFYCWQG